MQHCILGHCKTWLPLHVALGLLCLISAQAVGVPSLYLLGLIARLSGGMVILGKRPGLVDRMKLPPKAVLHHVVGSWGQDTIGGRAVALPVRAVAVGHTMASAHGHVGGVVAPSPAASSAPTSPVALPLVPQRLRGFQMP